MLKSFLWKNSGITDELYGDMGKEAAANQKSIHQEKKSGESPLLPSPRRHGVFYMEHYIKKGHAMA